MKALKDFTLNVIHRRPACVHLYYPADEEAQRFMDVFNNKARPAKSFSSWQISELKALGINVYVKQHVMERDII